jgi:hypothetical protein
MVSEGLGRSQMLRHEMLSNKRSIHNPKIKNPGTKPDISIGQPRGYGVLCARHQNSSLSVLYIQGRSSLFTQNPTLLQKTKNHFLPLHTACVFVGNYV